jgi:hypothetical protein
MRNYCRRGMSCIRILENEAPSASELIFAVVVFVVLNIELMEAVSVSISTGISDSILILILILIPIPIPLSLRLFACILPVSEGLHPLQFPLTLPSSPPRAVVSGQQICSGVLF